jgi:hypothetical protein
MRLWRAVLPTLWLCACGGAAGKIDGKVSVSGGSAANVGVVAVGPTTSAAVTDSGGAFTLTGITDGTYVVSAHVDGAQPPDQQAVVQVTKGAAEMNPTLVFHLPAGTVSGKVVLSDGSDPSNIAVALSGTQSVVTQTDSTGAFSFMGLPNGGYSLSVDLSDTREKHQTVSFKVVDNMALMLPDLVFTPTGTLTGTVKNAMNMPAANVQVRVLGTGLEAVTDAMGNFELDDVTSGTRTLSSFLPGAIPEYATTNVTVVRGMNPALMISLSTNTGPLGTVEGSVTFWHAGFDTFINVTATGSGVTAQASAQGYFSMQLPPGEWDIVATAPIYPNQFLAHVTVWENATVTLPPAHLSIYKRFDLDPGISSASINTAPSEIGDWFTYSTGPAGPMQQWYVANAHTLSRRLFFVGAPGLPQPILSRTGHYLAYDANQVNVVIDLTTGNQVSLMRPVGPAPIHNISTDESAYFMGDNDGSVGMTRYTFATAARKDYPGIAVPQTRDRWFVNNNNAVTLVTPAMDYQEFTTLNATNITSGSSLAPVPWAFTNCSGVPGAFSGCQLSIVPPQGTAPVQVQGTYSYPGTTLQATALYDATADYFVLTTTSPTQTWKLVKIVDGTTIDLPANTYSVDFNETGSRLVYLSNAGGMIQVHEEATPPTGTAAPVATLGASMVSGWVSPTRYVIFDNSATPRRIEVKVGVATPDTDYIVNTGVLYGPFAYWSTSGNMKRSALVADSMVYPLDIPAMDAVTAAGGTEGTGPGRWGAISDNVPANFKGTFVLDASKPAVRTLTQMQVSLPGLRGRSYPAAHWGSGDQGYLTFSSDEFWLLNEPGVSNLTYDTRVGGDSLFLGVVGLNGPVSQIVIADVPFP